MRQKILVPLDGSDFAEGILEDVVDLAAGGRADVVLVGVGSLPQEVMIDAGRAIYVDEQLNWVEQEMQAYLHQVERRLRARGLEVETATGFGDAVSEILRYAESNGVTLIAMATHARAGLDALLHRSVARNVYHRATVPVLLKKWKEREVAAKAA